MKRWLAWALVVFALHFIWEMAQARWFATIQGLPFWTATLLCLRAAVADVAITAAIYLVTAAFFRDLRWGTRLRWTSPAIVFLGLGILVTLAIELWAISQNRWVYAADMPVIGGVGVLPLLQWTFIPAAIVAITRLTFHRNPA